jgi:hypothetical protein
MKTKIMLKGCPRCHGDLVPDRWDLEGNDMCCVQCGFSATPAMTRRLLLGQPLVAPRRLAVLANGHAA